MQGGHGLDTPYRRLRSLQVALADFAMLGPCPPIRATAAVAEAPFGVGSCGKRGPAAADGCRRIQGLQVKAHGVTSKEVCGGAAFALTPEDRAVLPH